MKNGVGVAEVEVGCASVILVGGRGAAVFQVKGTRMFSARQKREISDKVQKILRDTARPELPDGEIQFNLHVDGAESWSWADVRNNGAVPEPKINPWNENQDKGDRG